MPDYVERKAIRDALYDADAITMEGVKILNQFPTADVAPVVHGRWEWHEEWRESSPDSPAECQNAGWECSECKIDLSEYLSETLGETVYCDDPDRYPTINRCPNCGARMDKEADHE